jgi:uncharacterized protein (TIGR00251 family)
VAFTRLRVRKSGTVANYRSDSRSSPHEAGLTRRTSALRIKEYEAGVRFAGRVEPRAARSEIVGLHGDALKVQRSAPPVDGAANVALVEVLADALGVPRHSVRIVSGATSRGKIVEVDGVNVENIRRLARRSK